MALYRASSGFLSVANLVLSVIIGSFCWLFLLSIFLLPLTILFLIKCIVIAFAYLLYDNLYSISTTDAAFAIGCTWKKSKLSVGLLLQVQGHLELAQIQNKFYSSLLQHKIGRKPKYEKLYSCLVTFGGYVFRKLLPMEALQLDKHIYIKNLKYGECLETVIADWMDKAYAELTPAWEMMLVPLLISSPPSPEAGESDVGKAAYETAVCFKIHHVFADGYSLLHILDALTDNSSPYLVKDPMESWTRKLLDILCFPINLRLLVGDASPKHNPIRIISPQSKWMYAFTSVDLETVKAVRKKYDVHFASVILTLTAGSLRKFILDRGLGKKLPKYLAVANTLPEWPQHPALNHHLCNHWTLGIIKSPITVDDPLSRLLETEKDFQAFHQAGLHKVVTNYLFPFAWLFPAGVAEKALEADRFGYNLGLTSLVGGNHYKILGQPVTRIYPLLTLVDTHPYTAFSWFTFSHSGRLDITLAAAPTLFSDQLSLEKVVSNSFKNELQKLCEQGSIKTLSPEKIISS